MVKPLKKPPLLKYRNVMLPHLLPIKAKEAGISSADKDKWKELVKNTRQEVERRYRTSSTQDLVSDMCFERCSKKQKEKKRVLQNTANKGKSSPIYELKRQYLQTNRELIPQPVVTDDYDESNYIMRTLKCSSDSTRLWIEDRRLELLQKISKTERTFAEAIAQSGYKVVVKMPFVCGKKIYFCNLYIPALHFAIDISDVLYTEVAKDADKTNDLKYIGITRLRIKKADAAKPKTLEMLIQSIVK